MGNWYGLNYVPAKLLFCNPRLQHLMTVFRNKVLKEEMKLDRARESGPQSTEATARIRRDTKLGYTQRYQRSSNSRVAMHRSSGSQPCRYPHLSSLPAASPQPPGWLENRNAYCLSYLFWHILLWCSIKLMLELDFCLFIQQTLREHLQCPDLYNRMYKTDKAKKDKNSLCSQEALSLVGETDNQKMKKSRTVCDDNEGIMCSEWGQVGANEKEMFGCVCLWHCGSQGSQSVLWKAVDFLPEEH